MKHGAFAFAIEELAYAVGVLGGTEVARGYLTALLGERPQQELEGRLLAASHALVARGYLDFDAASGDKKLKPDLAPLVDALIQHDYFLQCTRAGSGQEAVLNFHVTSDLYVAHWIEKSVVAHLEALTGQADVVARAGAFFDISASSAFADGPQQLGTIPADLLQKIGQSLAKTTPEQIAAQLNAAGLPVDIARPLAEDLHAPTFRGSVMKVKVGDVGILSDRGFLIFQGLHGCWFFEILPKTPPMLDVCVGSLEQFHRLFQALMA